MVNKLAYDVNTDLDFHEINEKILNLETILTKSGIYNENRFRAWYKDFNNIYGEKDTNVRLYLIHSLLYFIGLNFIFKFILKDKEILSSNELTLKKFKEIEENIKSKYKNTNIIDFDYFTPIYILSEKQDLTFLIELISKISNYFFKPKINPIHIFDNLFQKIISPLSRHKSGEYYTPSFLVKKMVNEAYSFGDMVLDPCCGSGNFLIGAINDILSQEKSDKEKLFALNRIWGFDINPISIYLTKINLLFLTKDLSSEIRFNLYVYNFLYLERSDLHEKFDLIIGNPPWYTYRDIDSIYYQERLKTLAEELEIKPRPKNLLNLEISTLFFYKAQKFYMKNKGKIFFVITKGVITGSHASRFRSFKGFSDIKLWLFDKKIENIFNIDFICLFARKSKDMKEHALYEVPTYHFGLEHNDIDLNNYDSVDIVLQKEEIYVPFSIEQKGEKIYIKKLISKEKLGDLLPLGESYYKHIFHKGADLNPRNLIFVKFQSINDFLAKINPDERIFKKAKAPWDKKEFENEIIEKKYLFRVLKSTELVKFHIYDYYNVFLPLLKSDLSFNFSNLDETSKQFYEKINNLYLRYKKETTAHNSLMENLNRWSKLINSRQLSKIKVVYNNSGSQLNSAVIQGDFIVTGDLSYYGTTSLDEANYLAAILNSSILTEQIKIMKSSRHIFKLPFNIPIKKFDLKNPIHQQLAKLGQQGQEIAITIIERFYKENNEELSKIKIQNILNKELKFILNQIDLLIIKELRPYHN
ncbi:MAG: class I SAM-dependent DNA methyltransferase [Promethearchaeota archaeon]